MANVSFFGMSLTPGQEEIIPIPAGIVLHISQVTLATEGQDGEVTRIFAVIEEDGSDDEEDVNTSVQKERREFAIATLVGKSKESQNLELNFSEIDGDVCFKAVGGRTHVHLTGYFNQVSTEDEMFGEFDSEEEEELNGKLPPNFVQYESDEDDEDFKVNASALDDNNDSGYFIQGGSDEESEDEEDEAEADQDIQASLEMLKKQIAQQESSKKRKNAPTTNETASKKQKTEAKKPQQQNGTPKKQEAAAPKKQDTPKQTESKAQSGKKNNKKNKKNNKKK